MSPLNLRAVSGRRALLLIAICIAIALVVAMWLLPPRPRAQGGPLAPEFPSGLEWINSERPLQLADLRGKFVLLDFLTYGCINCIHVIPDLHALEEEYGDSLVVLGVHSAKFEHERGTENITRFAQRYGIDHPIVNDRNFEIWEAYRIYAWPSSVLIDPQGRVVGRHAGEGVFTAFDGLLSELVERADANGTLDPAPLDLAASAPSLPGSPLRFPSKVLAHEGSDRLFIADTSHHRIVVTDLEGSVLAVIGSGEPGFRDGSSSEAAFLRPHGLALAPPDVLYVADTGNHAIRRVDLTSGRVTTVAGTGEQEYMFAIFEAPALEHGLNSPWDLLWLDGRLYIAMAGQHQIWRYDPATEMLYLHAGSGREALADGPLRGSALNQPTGLATDGELLFIADSEASAIRRAGLEEDSKLDTIVGTGLFDFGDVDGSGDEVLLQHAEGVAWHDRMLYVADTYNNKIKRIDPLSRTATTIFGSGEPGWRDGSDPLFYEPTGISAANGSLYIADANNHAIRVADLSTGEVSTLELSDAEGLLAGPESTEYFGATVALEDQRVREGPGELLLEISLPRDYKVNDLAPLHVSWSVEGEAVTVEPASRETIEAHPEYPFSLMVPAHFTRGESRVTAELDIYYCREGAEALCLVDRVRLVVPVTVTDRGDDQVRLARTPPPVPTGM
ncbi:MAG TPA: thioredoxin-like domain-containing protein [Trueperaceae bacterium]